jgi:hypothetical protein
MSTTTARRKARRTQPVESTAGRDSFLAFGRRIIRAYGRRTVEGDLDALTGLVELQSELQAAILKAGADAHTFGYSWTEIGAALGTSRQAAERRFSGTAATTVRTAK